jgi:hypothetical protein
MRPPVPCLLLRTALPLLLVALPAAPAAAQHLGVASAGFRAGVGDGPDQAVFGLAFDLGELAPRLRLQPSLDFATGERGFDSIGLLAAVHYRFPPAGAFHPYAGGGFHFGVVDPGDGGGFGRRGGSDLDLAPVLVGGVDYPLGRRTGLQRLTLELDLGGGDAFDARLLFGVMF